MTHARRRYLLVCYDGTRCTLDDFRHSGLVRASGRRRGFLGCSRDDAFVLFDMSASAITGHGRLTAPSGPARGGTRDPRDLVMSGAVSRKANRPLQLADGQLAFLREPACRRLSGWQDRAVTRLARTEFDAIFLAWWGIEGFSSAL